VEALVAYQKGNDSGLKERGDSGQDRDSYLDDRKK